MAKQIFHFFLPKVFISITERCVRFLQILACAIHVLHTEVISLQNVMKYNWSCGIDAIVRRMETQSYVFQVLITPMMMDLTPDKAIFINREILEGNTKTSKYVLSLQIAAVMETSSCQGTF